MDVTPISPPFSSGRSKASLANWDGYEAPPMALSPLSTRLRSGTSSQNRLEVGLGISFYQEEAPATQPQLCPPVDIASAPGWSDVTFPNSPCSESFLRPGDNRSIACYRPYEVLTPISYSPVSLYSPHDMDLSPTIRASSHMAWNLPVVPGHNISVWSTTPGSEMSTPTEICFSSGDGPKTTWSASWPANHMDTTAAETFASLPLSLMPESYGYVDSSPALQEEYHHGHPDTRSGQEQLTSSVGKVTSTNQPSRKRKSASEDDLRCPVCGFVFTRRSNCKVHLRRHDPTQKTAFPCLECNKSFGRRTDLRRHENSIHRKQNRFDCSRCRRCFSRQDTLSRHQADCRQRHVFNNDNVDADERPLGHATDLPALA